MKIGIIFAGPYPEGIGASERISLLARMMQQAGASPTVLVPFFPSFPRTGTLREGISEMGIPYRYLTVLRRRDGWKKALDHFRYFLSVRRELRKVLGEFDAFYLYSFTPLQMAPVLQVLEEAEVPFAIEHTELRSALLVPSRSWKERLLRRVSRRLEKRVPPSTRALVVISEALERFYRPLFSGPIFRLPIIADYDGFTPAPADRPPPYRIGYMGGFSHKDGIDGILRSFLRLHGEMPRLRLSLIGFSPNLWRIRQWLARYGLPEAVDFHINVPYRSLPEVLGACDTLVMNRIDIPASHYGFPTKVGEYLATGVPVIATRVSDLPRYLTHGEDVFFIPPDDTDALADALRRRYARYEDFQEIGRRGRESGLRHFHYRRYVPTIRQVLSLLG